MFCERHFAEQVKPRCGACDELIFAGEYTRAMNRDWHANHFCCTHCVQPLTGKRYVLRDGNPICLNCYEGHFANQCSDCAKPIGIEGRDLAYKDRHWHEVKYTLKLPSFSLSLYVTVLFIIMIAILLCIAGLFLMQFMQDEFGR